MVSGAEKFNSGLENLGSVLEINMAFNSLGNEGIRNMQRGLTENFITTKIDLSHNLLDSNVAPIFGEIFEQNKAFEEINLSWNNINTPAGKNKHPHTKDRSFIIFFSVENLR